VGLLAELVTSAKTNCNFFRTRRIGVTDLLLDVGSFFWCCSWNDTRIGKAGAQQGRHGKYKQQATDDRNRYRYVRRQVTAAEKMRLDRGLAEGGYLLKDKKQRARSSD
jgi:hypothetical protein